MSTLEFVLEPLRLGGAEVRLFAPVKPDGIDVTAAVLAWLDLQQEALRVYSVTHMAISEDDWYDRAQSYFDRHKETLVNAGRVGSEFLETLSEDYFAHYPNVEVEKWLEIMAGRLCDDAQTTCYH